MDTPVGDTLPCGRHTPQCRRNLEHDNTTAFDIQLVDVDKGGLVIGVF